MTKFQCQILITSQDIQQYVFKFLFRRIMMSWPLKFIFSCNDGQGKKARKTLGKICENKGLHWPLFSHTKSYSLVQWQNLRICPYTGEYVSEKTRILTYFMQWWGNTKTWISQEQKELFRWNKNYFSETRNFLKTFYSTYTKK